MAGEAIRWDGKPETLERLRDLMPDVIVSDLGFGGLRVKTLRNISAKQAVHGERIVPAGWYLTLKTCKHGERYAAIKPPETVNA